MRKSPWIKAYGVKTLEEGKTPPLGGELMGWETIWI